VEGGASSPVDPCTRKPMPAQPLLCYITDRTQFSGDEASRRRRLIAKIADAARHSVDYIQLREKDLSAKDLEELARAAVTLLRDSNLRTEDRGPRTVLLINSRTDVALAIGAHGVHLPSGDISPAEVRNLWTRAASYSAGARVTISKSCHQLAEVQQSALEGADFAIFAPVFGKKAPDAHPAGLEALRQACLCNIPVLALGGITLDNARSCLEAGAAGIAAIRLFQENDIAEIVGKIRSA
jgi:thiamine-phosphate pyrophosphorylase